MSSHATAARQHARMRFRERFGVWMPKGVYIDICDEIAAGLVPMVGHGHEGAEVYRVKALARDAYAVWCPHLQRILTFTETLPACLRTVQA